MIPLEQIKIASPCHANWDEMTGTDQARFCQSCRKNVYNLSEMTRAEAEALIQEKEGCLCVRFYTRADGTLLTQDCPVGLRALRVKLAKRLSYAAALLLSCVTGLMRWPGVAHAVTVVKRQSPAAKSSVKPRVVRPVPKSLQGQPTMGAPIAVMPHPMMGKPIVPPSPLTHTMGQVVLTRLPAH